MAELTDTLAARVRQRASGRGEDTAFLQKRHGVWDRWSWRRVDDIVDALARGLAAAGLACGEAVAIVSGARVEAVLAVYACQRAGLVPVLLGPGMPAGGLARQAEQAGVVAVLAEDQEQVDKVADMQSRLPGLRRLWVIDDKGTRGYAHIAVVAWRELLAGAATQAPAERGGPTALALFSAGIFGEPRLLRVSHRTVLLHASAGGALGLAEGERCASLFGLSDPLGHFFHVVAPVLFGSVACFGEDGLPNVPELRQCAPRVVAIPGRLLDRLRRETAARASQAGGLRRALVERWSAAATPSWWLRQWVGSPIADALGLGACRCVMTGYERMAPASAHFLARLGIAARGLYGIAEAAGPVASFARAELPDLRMFDPYPPQVEANGELIVRVDGDAVATGDLATLEGDAVHVLGRAADLLCLADGQRLAPAAIEAELRASPYINQVVAVGGPATGITALVELDEVTLRDWARSLGLAFTTLRSFAESREVRQLVDDAVAEANRRLPKGARIVRAILLPRALEIANGELTPSLALRRPIVRNRYAHRLAAGGSPEFATATAGDSS